MSASVKRAGDSRGRLTAAFASSPGRFGRLPAHNCPPPAACFVSACRESFRVAVVDWRTSQGHRLDVQSSSERKSEKVSPMCLG
jgi:hypothetical protein